MIDRQGFRFTIPREPGYGALFLTFHLCAWRSSRSLKVFFYFLLFRAFVGSTRLSYLLFPFDLVLPLGAPCLLVERLIRLQVGLGPPPLFLKPAAPTPAPRTRRTLCRILVLGRMIRRRQRLLLVLRPTGSGSVSRCRRVCRRCFGHRPA